MAKVLISHIGTGRKKRGSDREYDPTVYKFNEYDKEYETTFLAAALSDYLKVDKIIFIGTSKSMWEEIYRYFTEKAGKVIDENYWIRIAELSSNSGHDKMLVDRKMLKETMEAVDYYLKAINPKKTGISVPLLIKYGLNEEELWENFRIIMGLIEILENGDEIYIDITHSFRSIPLFIYLLMDFIKTLNYKNIALKGLYYGMFEAKEEKGYTPVVDLSPLLRISDWITGTYNFINYGNGYLISELSSGNEEVSKRVKNISELINLNYLIDLQKQIRELNKIIDNKIGIEAMEYIVPVLKKYTMHFGEIKDSSEFQLELSGWYFENKRYGHGYICLAESILTKICEVYKLDIAVINNREEVKQFLCNRDNRSKCNSLDSLCKKYISINKIRNRIAHASFFQSGNYSFSNDINLAIKYYYDVKTLLDSKEINELSSIISWL